MADEMNNIPPRVALRDITEQPGFPHSIDWPVLPASVPVGV